MVFIRSLATLSTVLLGFGANQAVAYDGSKSSNLAVYWGQNSYGATHGSDTANWQQTLSTYCADDTIDAIPLAFLNVFFGAGSLPSIDFANICSVNTGVFNGTQLPDCSKLASDIKTCQGKGKIVTLSMGGATGANVFTSADQASGFADQIWNLFFEGTSDTRPLGDAVLDGVDLDIEGGSTTYYDAFLTQLQTHFSSGSKKFYVTAAPQCPFPDAYLGTLLNTAHFDAVYVQFYNNFCSLPNFGNSQDWDFGQWDDWAKNTSPNKDVKIFIGAPASDTAANAGSYVDASALGPIISATKGQYSSFGGVMLWDASQAYANGRYDQAVKALLTGGAVIESVTPPTPVTDGADCVSVNSWVANVRYEEGDQVIYAGHLYAAPYWSYASIPGGEEKEDWTDKGACAVKKNEGTPAQAKPAQKSAPTEVPKSIPTSAAKGAKRSRVYRA